MNEAKSKFERLEKFKYPLLMLLLGIFLMLLPSGSGKKSPQDADAVFEQIISSSEGVGEARVIVSENGVVVVCRGAENAKVRLDIIRAIGAYTGFGADKITVLKLAD